LKNLELAKTPKQANQMQCQRAKMSNDPGAPGFLAPSGSPSSAMQPATFGHMPGQNPFIRRGNGDSVSFLQAR
jgi:hypothetical protein